MSIFHLVTQAARSFLLDQKKKMDAWQKVLQKKEQQKRLAMEASATKAF